MEIMLTARYLDELTALGVTIPEKSQNAVDIYRAAMAAAAQAPTDELRKALEAGQVTPENVAALVHKAAADQTAQQNAHTIVRDLHRTLNATIKAGIRDDLARIHNELNAVFKPAARGIAAAVKHGIDAATTGDEAIARGAEAVDAYRKINAHASTLEQVQRAYLTLFREIAGPIPAQPVALFIGETTELDRAAELYRGGPTKWLALAAAGFELRLNDRKGADKVLATDEAAREQVAAAEREIELRAHRSRHRIELAAASAAMRSAGL